ncbi:MAG: glutathione S-transferase [Betaproteobacteria bacterium]
MKLYTAATSPYSRKVRIVLIEKKIECEYVDANPWDAQSAVPQFNPLGKIPVLILDDGTMLYDSRVIVGYLDTVTPVSRLIPEPSRQRIAVRRWEALADGVCDAVLSVVRETKRPAHQQSSEWIAYQGLKMQRGVAEMSSDLGDRAWCSGDAYTLADIATGCALGYLDLRQPAIAWRTEFPNLLKLAEKLAKRSSFAETAPPTS